MIDGAGVDIAIGIGIREGLISRSPRHARRDDQQINSIGENLLVLKRCVDVERSSPERDRSPLKDVFKCCGVRETADEVRRDLLIFED